MPQKYDIPTSATQNAILGALLGLTTAGGMEAYRRLTDPAKAISDSSFQENELVVHRTPIKKKLQRLQAAADASEEQPETTKIANADTSMWNESAKNLGLIGGFGGTYYLANKLFQKLRKEDLQKQLESAHIAHVSNLADLNELSQMGYIDYPVVKDRDGKKKHDDIEKIASDIPSKLGGGLITSLALAAMASAALTPRIMERTFPTPSSDSALKELRLQSKFKPKVRIEDEPDEEEEVPPGTPVKQAAVDTYPLELENLYRTVYHIKEAAENGFQDIIHAVANGKSDILVQSFGVGGYDLMYDSVKGQPDTDQYKKSAAFIKIAHDPVLSAIVNPMAVAELNEAAPTMIAIGANTSQEFKKVASELVRSIMETIHAEEFGEITEDLLKKADLNKEASLGMHMTHNVVAAMDLVIGTSSIRDVLGLV